MQSVADRTIDKQKEELFLKIQTLADQCGWIHGNRTPYATLVKIISSISCERRIMDVLANNNVAKEEQKFDPYFLRKSEFATVKILDHVKTSLSTNGFSDAVVLTEAPSQIGRYDAIIVLGSSRKVHAEYEGKIRIEIKGSLGLDLEQIERYMWDDPSTLILVRVMTAQVAIIKPNERQAYLAFYMEDLHTKINRLLQNKPYTIPGTTCTDCPDDSCVYWRKRGKSKESTNIVTLPDTDFAQDLTTFFQNLSYVAEKTAILVVEELKIASTHNQRPIPQQLRIG
jgi:hypothetical protein